MSNASSLTSSKKIPNTLVTELEKNIVDLINNYDTHSALNILEDLLVKQGLGLGPLSNQALGKVQLCILKNKLLYYSHRSLPQLDISGDPVTGDIEEIKVEVTPNITVTTTSTPTALQLDKTRLQQGQEKPQNKHSETNYPSLNQQQQGQEQPQNKKLESDNPSRNQRPQDDDATLSSPVTSTQYSSITNTGNSPSQALPLSSSVSSSLSSTSSSIAPPSSLPFPSSSKAQPGRKRKLIQRENRRGTQKKQRELRNDLIDDHGYILKSQTRNILGEPRVQKHTQIQDLEAINEALISTLNYNNWVTNETLKIKNAVTNMQSIQQQQQELESSEICELEKLYRGIEGLSKQNLVVKLLTRIKLMLFYMKKEEDETAFNDWKKTNDNLRRIYDMEKNGKRFLEIFDVIGSTLFILTDSITTPRVRDMNINEFRILLIYLSKHNGSSFKGIKFKDLDESNIKNNDNSTKVTFLKKLETLILQNAINDGWVKETVN